MNVSVLPVELARCIRLGSLRTCAQTDGAKDIAFETTLAFDWKALVTQRCTMIASQHQPWHATPFPTLVRVSRDTKVFGLKKRNAANVLLVLLMD